MKNAAIYALLLTTFSSFKALGVYEILELGDGKGKAGPVKLEVLYKDKQTDRNTVVYLETIEESDINDLVRIRTSAEVCKHYSNHKEPEVGAITNWFKNTLMPRVGSDESVLPFVLKNEDKEVKGLINVGYGFEQTHRMFGNFTESGENGSQWNRGRCKAAVEATTDFIMLWHKDNPGQQHINFNGQSLKLWGPTFDILSATADVDNISGRRIFDTLGM
ncbi:MAG TPA: hypothetical protein VI959_03835, partial [Alphaproteobacteria bacterium]|nr:hypothetical protein [Alphaproteobacteria bacterium]